MPKGFFKYLHFETSQDGHKNTVVVTQSMNYDLIPIGVKITQYCLFPELCKVCFHNHAFYEKNK